MLPNVTLFHAGTGGAHRAFFLAVRHRCRLQGNAGFRLSHPLHGDCDLIDGDAWLQVPAPAHVLMQRSSCFRCGKPRRVRSPHPHELLRCFLFGEGLRGGLECGQEVASVSGSSILSMIVGPTSSLRAAMAAMATISQASCLSLALMA